MALARTALLVAILAGSPASAQDAATSPAPYAWIFTGSLPATGENFSGTLASDAADAQFELRLAGGATCSGGRLEDDVGVVTLHDVTCSDGRRLRARFVAEGGTDLRVFGSIDEEEFIVDAHLIDFDAPADSVSRKTWPPALPPIPRHRPLALPRGMGAP